jgi:hypothetical protein
VVRYYEKKTEGVAGEKRKRTQEDQESVRDRVGPPVTEYQYKPANTSSCEALRSEVIMGGDEKSSAAKSDASSDVGAWETGVEADLVTKLVLGMQQLQAKEVGITQPRLRGYEREDVREFVLEYDKYKRDLKQRGVAENLVATAWQGVGYSLQDEIKWLAFNEGHHPGRMANVDVIHRLREYALLDTEPTETIPTIIGRVPLLQYDDGRDGRVQVMEWRRKICKALEEGKQERNVCL